MSVKAVGEFVGREREIHEISAEVFSPRSGWGAESSVLYLEGEGGIGKTTLVLELAKILSDGRRPFDFSPTGSPDSSRRIALLQEFSNSAYSERFVSGIHDIADRLGLLIEIFDSRGAIDQMGRILRQIVDSKPSAVIISLGTNADLGPEVDRASELGVPVVTADNFDEMLRSARSSITQANVEQALVLCKRLCSDLDNRGDLLVLHDTGLAPFRQRHLGLMEGLKMSKGIRTVELDVPMGNPDQFRQRVFDSTLDALQLNPDITAIWTPWSELIDPVADAIRAVAPRDIGLYSFDVCSATDLDEIQSESHPWRAAVSVNPFQAGQAAARLAALLAYGQDVDTHYTLPYQLFVKGSPDSNAEITAHSELSALDIAGSNIGLTPWLQLKLAQIGPEPYVLTLPIFDFDDTTYRDPKNIWFTAAADLSRRNHGNFSRFFDLFAELVGLPRIDVDSRQQNELRKCFVDTLNSVAKNYRIVFLFDTVDALQKEEAQKIALSVSSVLSTANNCVWLFAGRNRLDASADGRFFDALNMRLSSCGIAPVVVRLGALDEYIEAIQNALENDGVRRMSDALVEQTVKYFGAKPIWISLAALWHANHSEEHLKVPIADLTNEQFEALLVSDTIRAGDNVGRVLFALSHIYPLSRELAMELFPEFSVAEVERLLLDCAELPYVKSVPSYVLQMKPIPANATSLRPSPAVPNIALSDVMRVLIQKHVWNRVDPAYIELARLSEIAHRHYDAERSRVAESIKSLRESRRKGRDVVFPEAYRPESYETAFRIEQESLSKKSFYHHMLSRTDALDNTARVEIDRARHFGNTYLAEALCDLARSLFLDKHKLARRLTARAYSKLNEVVEIMEAVLLYDKQKAPVAKEKFDELIDKHAEHADLLLEIYNRRGVSRRKLGDFRGSLDDQNTALKLCGQLAINQAPILNQIGICHYLLGEWKEALNAFERAYELGRALDVQDDILIGSALNWQASVMRQLGDLDTATALCTGALDAWRGTGSDRWIARGEITMGSICRDLGAYDEAINYLSLAGSRIDEKEDRENAVSHLLQLGSAHRMRAESQAETSEHRDESRDLDDAQRYLERALEISEKSEYRERLVAIHFHLAKVFQAKGDLTLATRHANFAIDLSNRPWESGGVPDPRYQLDSNILAAELAFMSGGMSSGDIASLDEKLDAFSRSQYDEYPIQQGKVACLKARIHESRNDMSLAILNWKSGIASIAQTNGFGQIILKQELRHLRQALRKSPETQARSFIDELLGSWNPSSRITSANKVLLKIYLGQTLAINRAGGIG